MTFIWFLFAGPLEGLDKHEFADGAAQQDRRESAGQQTCDLQ